MRIRTIKPEFWNNENLSACSMEAHFIAAALLNYADDEGYFNANPKLIKAAIFALREDSLNIHGVLTELSNIGYLQLYENPDGRIYGYINKFSEHQKINRPSSSKIKGLIDDSMIIHGGFTEYSVRPHCRNREQGTGNREKKKTKTKVLSKQEIKLPDWITSDQWNELLQHRTRIKKPLRTERAMNGILSKLKEGLDSGYSVEEMLTAIDLNGWQGFNYEWMERANGNSNQTKNQGNATQGGYSAKGLSQFPAINTRHDGRARPQRPLTAQEKTNIRSAKFISRLKAEAATEASATTTQALDG